MKDINPFHVYANRQYFLDGHYQQPINWWRIIGIIAMTSPIWIAMLYWLAWLFHAR